MQNSKNTGVKSADLNSGISAAAVMKRWRSDSGFGSICFAFCVLHFAFCISSCRPSPQYQDHYNIPGGAWNAAYQPQFHFTITDTASAYQLFLLIRHTDVYPFSNIWMTMESKGPGDTTWRKTRVEVPLAAPSGQWLGRGAGELWEQRVPITAPAHPAFFARKGAYAVRLTHDMRRNPLPEVLTIGFRLEKLPPFRKEH